MVIIGVMTISSLLPIVSVSAAPQEVEDARNKYAAIEANIAEINEKIQTLDSEMVKLTNEMENNEKEIENAYKSVIAILLILLGTTINFEVLHS